MTNALKPVASTPPESASGGWRLGRVAGIELGIDRSWILIFLLLTFSLGRMLAAEATGWTPAQVWSTAFATSLLFFACILLHELGHSLTALHLGVRVRSITLFVFGGLAELESEPRRPRDEIRIALAGPLVSVTLGVAFRAVSGALAAQPGWGLAAVALGWLGNINLLLAAFNAVPGFPLDGGRVLRGIVWAVTGSFDRATRAAAASGAAFAWGLMGFGGFSALFAGQLLGGLWLVFIGWFLLSASRAAVGQLVFERVLGRMRVADAMEPIGDACLDGSETVQEIIERPLLQRGLRTFYVVDRAHALLGLLALRELVDVPAERRGATRAVEIMRPREQLEVLAPDETGWDALRKMASRRVHQLPVLEGSRLCGVLTRERLLTLVEAGLALGDSLSPDGASGPP